jgi:hypothetical protein
LVSSRPVGETKEPVAVDPAVLNLTTARAAVWMVAGAVLTSLRDGMAAALTVELLESCEQPREEERSAPMTEKLAKRLLRFNLIKTPAGFI